MSALDPSENDVTLIISIHVNGYKKYYVPSITQRFLLDSSFCILLHIIINEAVKRPDGGSPRNLLLLMTCDSVAERNSYTYNNMIDLGPFLLYVQ